MPHTLYYRVLRTTLNNLTLLISIIITMGDSEVISAKYTPKLFQIRHFSPFTAALIRHKFFGAKIYSTIFPSGIVLTNQSMIAWLYQNRNYILYGAVGTSATRTRYDLAREIFAYLNCRLEDKTLAQKFCHHVQSKWIINGGNDCVFSLCHLKLCLASLDWVRIRLPGKCNGNNIIYSNCQTLVMAVSIEQIAHTSNRIFGSHRREFIRCVACHFDRTPVNRCLILHEHLLTSHCRLLLWRHSYICHAENATVGEHILLV